VLVSDVVIPTNSPDRASIVLKAGQRVMVLKSPKGIYMQLENGKIIAIRTAFKVGGAGKGSAAQQQECKPPLEKAEMNAPEYKKGALPFIIMHVTVVVTQEKAISCQFETEKEQNYI
jgi:RAD54-like protein 2